MQDLITKDLPQTHMKKKLIIGIDFDDVIMDLSNHLLDFFNTKFKTNFVRADIKDFFMGVLWNLDREEEEKIIMEFCLSERHKNTLPVSGAIEAIRKLAADHELHIITAREEARKGVTLEWIDMHIPTVITSITFASHIDVVHSRKKSEICKELNVDCFIDDSLKNVLDVSTVVDRVFLLDTPWNQGDLPGNIERIFSWEEIIMKLS